MATPLLFPTAYLAALDRLTLALAPAPPQVRAGAHLSPRAGASLQFRDFAPYAQGDDLRRIDWNVYARTRHLFVRRFDHPAAAAVSILIDDSPSMRLGDPGRYPTAARLAAAVAAAAVSAHDPVRLVVGSAPAPPPTGDRRGLARLLAHLAAPRPPSAGSLTATINAALRRPAARGLLVVISDFFDDAGPDAIAAALGRHAGRLLCLRLTQEDDLHPAYDADDVVDCETRRRLTLSAGEPSAAIGRYRAAYESYFSSLDAHFTRRGARSFTFDVADEPLSSLSHLFPNGALRL